MDNQKQYTTPILLIVFNRTDTLQQVFNEIRKQKPKYLFVAGDGPREWVQGEVEQCQKARDIIKQIDWDCELKTFFRERNSGSAGVAVSSAVSWFFENVERGIIFEHDVIPHPDYFALCDELLEKYKDDERISLINGVNFQDGNWRGDGSYYFSTGSSNWGFATWRRFWKNYDLLLVNYSLENYKKDMLYYNFTWKSRLIMIDYFKLLKSKKIDDWAFQVHICMFKIHGLCIVPNVNMITNIGGGEGAYNLRDSNDPRLNRKIYPILPVVHPAKVERNLMADMYSYKHIGLRPVVYIPKTNKSIRIDIFFLPVALLWFCWRCFRRNFIAKKKY
jgi:hypothetical protein